MKSVQRETFLFKLVSSHNSQFLSHSKNRG
jgi:hypothetical protein